MTKTTRSTSGIARVILYVKDIPKVAAFYQRHFGMRPLPGGSPGWLELSTPGGGCSLALHQAAKTQKSGAAVKIVFAVQDVRGFVGASKHAGLKFGVIHETADFNLRMRGIPPVIPFRFPTGGLNESIPAAHNYA